MADALWWPENVQSFRKEVEADDRHGVAHLMIVTIGQMRGLDGVMLAEAVAGSPQADRLLYLYQHLEAGLFELEYAHRSGVMSPGNFGRSICAGNKKAAPFEAACNGSKLVKCAARPGWR